MTAQVSAPTISIHQVAKSRIGEVDFNNLIFGRQFADHMFVADYRNGSWTNLSIVPYEKLSISPANSCLHYGQTIFEGLKAYKNDVGEIMVFRPDENARRLNISAQRICMPELPEEIFLNGLRELLQLDRNWVPSTPGSSLYIRPFMFATDEYVGLRPSETYKFLIITSPVGAYYSAPVKVKIETHYSRACEGGIGFAKTAGNYAASMYPTKLADDQGYDQILWTDAQEHAYIEEAGSMNIMFIINGTLITAPECDTILPGITRKSVLQIAREWGMRVEERKASVKEVIEGIENGTLREAFGAGTAATIAHIIQIGYNGDNFQLPAVEQREFSNKVLHELEQLKHGLIEDSRGWIMKI